MQEDIVEKLTNFGFTINQAKVYLSIAQSGRTHVGKISKDTQLHRQDIYKLLPKLEKMGLIIKTIDKPFMVEALPVDRALENIVLKEKEKASKKIEDLENNIKEITGSIQKQPASKEEARFTLLTTPEAVASRAQLIFKLKTKNFTLVTTLENLRGPVGAYFRELIQNIAAINAKSRLIVVDPQEREEAKQIVQKLAPKNGYFWVKLVPKCACKNYQVLDNKEVWIGTQQKTQAGYPCILWTNDRNIVESYRENFVEAWNSPKATTIYQNIAPKELTAVFASQAVTADAVPT